MVSNITLPICVAILASSLTLGGYSYLFSGKEDTSISGLASGPGLTDLRTELAAMAAQRTRLEGQLQGISARLATLEETRARVANPAQVATTGNSALAEGATASDASAGQAPAMTGKAFRSLLPRVMRASIYSGASEEDQAAFWVAARTGDLLPKLLEELTAKVEASPNDADLRMDLADAYVTKLLTVPSGPERGVWGMKAEREWQQAIELNPDHWDAQFSLAYNYSMYPDFLNKTDDAIAGFERALEVQKRQPYDAKYARTYLGLVRMYKKKGKHDEALTVMRDAAALYPKNQRVLDTLKSLQEAKAKRGK